MYPPKPSSSPESWVGGLHASLQRAIGVLREDVRLEPNEEEGVEVTFALLKPLPEDTKSHLRGYIRAYAKASGWSITGLQTRKSGIDFRAALTAEDKATSKRSRKS